MSILSLAGSHSKPPPRCRASLWQNTEISSEGYLLRESRIVSRYQFWLGSYLRLRHADLAVIQTERFGLIVLEDLYEAHTSPEPRSSRLLLQTTTIEYSRHRRLCHTRHSERTHGMNLINLNSYLNHSITPSMRTRNGYDFITLRNISVGEELTVDYRTYGAEELVLVG
jgi:SET domain